MQRARKSSNDISISSVANNGGVLGDRELFQTGIPEADPLVVFNGLGLQHLGYEVPVDHSDEWQLTLLRSAEHLVSSGDFGGLQLGASSTHRLVVGSPDSLATTRIVIEVDDGNNGHVDDVIVLRDYTPTSYRTPPVVNEDVRAWPAPWNPALQPLQVRYSLKRAATVRLVMYNTLQQQVAELVAPRAHEAGTLY
ncbi:MAG: hypothetical protein JXA28_10200 [Bacteroidetes bacterium]|nr:hypothetical protein [Bacteroidota bacterium]